MIDEGIVFSSWEGSASSAADDPPTYNLCLLSFRKSLLLPSLLLSKNHILRQSLV